MKAWINPSVNKKQKEAVKEYIKEELKLQQIGSTRRVFKLFCVALHDEYGFGKGRLGILLSKISAVCDEKKNDPVFWSHMDKVIEQIGLDFPQEDYESMGE